jgi:ABC-type enterobactin transport system permease subunit
MYNLKLAGMCVSVAISALIVPVVFDQLHILSVQHFTAFLFIAVSAAVNYYLGYRAGQLDSTREIITRIETRIVTSDSPSSADS